MPICLSLSLVCQIMFPFDLSTINVLLIAAVTVLFILFVTVLMKLNPSTEKRELLETEIQVEKHKPLLTSTIAPRDPPSANIDASKESENPQAAISSIIEDSSIQAEQETPAPTENERGEIPRSEKIVLSARTESASSKRDCLHQFGYLRTLSKNAPIPDECFGCSKIVECLVKTKRR